MYVHLHWHSHFSILEWYWKVEKIINKAKELWMNSIAITDYNCLYSAIEFFKLAKQNNIKPIIWVEIPFVYDLNDKNTLKYPIYICLLAKDIDWFNNIVEISSIANTIWMSDFPKIDFKNIEKFSKWVICFIWWTNSFLWDQILKNEDFKKIEEYTSKFKQTFWENFYLEIVAQLYKNDRNLNKVNEKYIFLSEKFWIKLITNNNFHYINKQDKNLLMILKCIKNWIRFNELDSSYYENEYHIFSQDELVEVLQKNWFEQSKIEEMINNNIEIAYWISVSIPLWRLLFPNYQTSDEVKLLYEKYLSENVEK